MRSGHSMDVDSTDEEVLEQEGLAVKIRASRRPAAQQERGQAVRQGQGAVRRKRASSGASRSRKAVIELSESGDEEVSSMAEDMEVGAPATKRPQTALRVFSEEEVKDGGSGTRRLTSPPVSTPKQGSVRSGVPAETRSPSVTKPVSTPTGRFFSSVLACVSRARLLVLCWNAG